METLAQKNARLRALREARDGTPEQIAAARKAAKIAAQAQVHAANGRIFDAIGDALKHNPKALFQNLDALVGAFDHTDRMQRRVNRMPNR